MKRRAFLEFAQTAALAATVPNAWRIPVRPRFADDPFSLGVASGDPTDTAVMLWSRLAPRPLDPDGGMTGRVGVDWEVADDEQFSKVVQRGRATAAAELGHSLHVDVQGLSPDRWYFYRFTAGDAKSPVGRTRTTPAPGQTSALRLGVASCQHYEEGLFTAYEHMAAENLDLVTHLGDYIYEYATAENRVRRHATREIQSLDDYRIRYAQYKTDAHLQAAHAGCPWLITWDDHEVDNNYADAIGENRMESEEQMRNRRRAAYQAWWEHMPVRVPRATSWADLNITRRTAWGSLADFHVLDTRQYRSDQPCGDGNKVIPCGEREDPKHTLLGATQEQWLTAGMSASRARWQVLAQQIMVAPYDFRVGAEQQVSMDQWSGYPAALDRLVGTIRRTAPNRTVVLTGDIHSNWVNEIHANVARGEGPTVAAEFVATSISSGGDGADTSASVEATRSENPHMKWHSARRGYISCAVTETDWVAEYRAVPFISRPDAPVTTASKWRVERGKAGITAA